MVQRVLLPWNAAALPEIMAGAVQESKRGVPVPFHEGQAAGQQPGSAAGARGGGTAEAGARPNVEVNRRAEGTSELNRRLGAVGKGSCSGTGRGSVKLKPQGRHDFHDCRELRVAAGCQCLVETFAP